MDGRSGRGGFASMVHLKKQYTMKTILLIIGITMVGLVISYICTVEYRYRKFKKNLKKGDPIRIYIGEESDTGEFMSVNGCVVDVRTIEGVKEVYIGDIYPVMGYRYEK